MAAAMRYRALVRCGNLAAGMQHTNPESLAGLCGSIGRIPAAELPSQGPAPLSTWGFSLAARDWLTTLTERQAANGTCGLTGFSVMRSPVRGPFKVGRRIARQAPLNRPVRCTDAVAPGSREASEPIGLALLRPQPFTKKQR